MRHEMLTQRALSCIDSNTKKKRHADSAIHDACKDLARTQQKGLVRQSIFDIPCNHIKLNSPKKGGGGGGAE